MFILPDNFYITTDEDRYTVYTLTTPDWNSSKFEIDYYNHRGMVFCVYTVPVDQLDLSAFTVNATDVIRREVVTGQGDNRRTYPVYFNSIRMNLFLDNQLEFFVSSDDDLIRLKLLMG